MKKSRTQLKKALQAFVNRMTKEEFAASLEKAGLEFYKNIKAPVFNGSKNRVSERTRKVDNYSDKTNKGRFIGSLPMPEIDNYEIVHVPFFKIPQKANADWTITHINLAVEFPSFLSHRQTMSPWTFPHGKWYLLPPDTKLGTGEVCEIEYYMAA